MNEKTKDEMKKFFKGILGDAVVLALSLIYTLTAFLTLSTTGKSAWQIVAEGIVAFMMGFFMNREFEHQGFCEGDVVDVVKKASDKHSAMIDSIVPYIDELEDWCDEKNRQALKHSRERILAERCLKYSDYFDENGAALEFVPDKKKLKNKHLRKLEISRIRTYHKAITLHLTPLNANVLISEGGKEGDPFYLGRSKTEYSKESSRKDVIVKVVLAVLFGYYGVTLIQNWSVANLIWKLFQVITFLMMGTIKKQQAISYMTEEYRGRITQKTMHLQTFLNFKEPNVHNNVNKKEAVEDVQQQS